MSRLQKVVLVYIGVKSKNENKPYINRIAFTKGLREVLNVANKKSFSVTISSTVKSLVKRNLVSRRAKTVGLTKEGREEAKNAIDEIKNEQGGIDWERIKGYYDRK